MNDEPIAIYDQLGRRLGVRGRAEVHARGLWHRAANLLLFRSNGNLVLQQRSSSKDVCPLLWDLSVAEHLTPTENYAEAAIRGLQEELGLVNVAITPVGSEITATFTAPGINDREFQQTFEATSDAPLQPDPGEVARIDEMSLADVQARVADTPERFTPWFRNVLSSLNYTA